uniref:protein NATD1-like n=1 Tax=Semicossyphus pulcher TaxID=241346 RepID=UPI0037E996AD
MTSKILSRLSPLTLRLRSWPSALSALSSRRTLTVDHDRHNQCFTVAPGSGTGAREDCAVLLYRFTGEQEVDLMSTYVPETFRGRGVAALLSQAAMDFVVEENLKAHISCWYIKKFIEEHPVQRYKERVLT